MLITIEGKQYPTVDAGVFTEHSGCPAKVVSGTCSESGEAVVILNAGRWMFINQNVN